MSAVISWPGRGCCARDRDELRYQDILKGPIRLEDVFAEAVSRADRGAAA